MFFKSLLTAGLVASTYAAPVYSGLQAGAVDAFYRYVAKMDNFQMTEAGQTLFDDLKKLDTDTVAIDAMVVAFNGDPADAIKVQVASEALAKDIKVAQGHVKAQKGLYAVQDSINLLPIFDTFIPDTKKVVKDLISKKDIFQKAQVTSVVLSSLQRQKDLGGKLNDMVFARLPAIAKPIDKKQWSQINEQLDAGIKAFTDPEDAPADAPAEGPAPSAPGPSADAPAKMSMDGMN